jgi:DNA-binding GntR family transcriptional regulator
MAKSKDLTNVEGSLRPRSLEERALLKRWQAATAENDRSRSLSELVHQTLSSAIVDRVLPAGWRLTEERLGGLFDVSRTPVREALAGLTSSKLAFRDERGKLCVSGVTPEQILHVYQVRSNLEALSARLAAEAASPRMLTRLKEQHDGCEAALEREDFETLVAANIAFHTAIARCTENGLLVQFIDDIHTWIRRFPTTTLSFPGRAETAMAEHRELIDAIGAHDPSRAEEIALRHMQAAEQVRLAMFRAGYEQFQDNAGRPPHVGPLTA